MNEKSCLKFRDRRTGRLVSLFIHVQIMIGQKKFAMISENSEIGDLSVMPIYELSETRVVGGFLLRYDEVEDEALEELIRVAMKAFLVQKAVKAMVANTGLEA